MKLSHFLTYSLMTAGTSAFAASDKPNILFIMSDDHAAHAIGAYGGRLAKLNPTPNLDQLAGEGVLMENAFCTNAICTPSRACIMTGQYSGVNGVLTLGENLPEERQYLAHEMKAAGYETAVIGKWHLKLRPSSFDYYKVLPGQGKYFNPVFFEGTLGDKSGKKVKMTGQSSDCVTDSVLAWLKGRAGNGNKPFFLKYHFKAPHDNFEYAPRYEPYLADVKIPEPASMYDNGNNGSIATRGHNDELVNRIGSSIGGRHAARSYFAEYKIDTGIEADKAKSMAYQKYMRRYLRCVKGIDDNIKRVTDYLKEIGEYDNTVVIYTGDQGFYLGEHDYRDKRWAYEEGMRMPFIVRYPKTIKAGSRSDAIVENVDYGPTMLEFAGVPTPDYMQGKSFKSIIETGTEPESWKKSAYYHYWMHMKHHYNPAHIAVRTKRYKLIMYYGTGWTGEDSAETPPAWELYDLQRDPKEMSNIYDNPEYTPVIKQLKAELKRLRSEYKEDDQKFAFNKVIEEFWDYDSEDRQRAIEISEAFKNTPLKTKKRKKKK